MAKRPLPSQEVLRQLLRYDDATGKLYWLPRSEDWFRDAKYHTPEGKAAQWNAKYADREAFTSNNKKGYRIGAVLGTGYLAHRVIWKLIYGCDPLAQIDHMDGDTSNNRVSNLRMATAAENAQNRRVSCVNNSGQVGVSLTENGTWSATIKVNRRARRLGTFKTKDEASEAYRKAKRLLHPFQPEQREAVQ